MDMNEAIRFIGLVRSLVRAEERYQQAKRLGAPASFVKLVFRYMEQTKGEIDSHPLAAEYYGRVRELVTQELFAEELFDETVIGKFKEVVDRLVVLRTADFSGNILKRRPNDESEIPGELPDKADLGEAIRGFEEAALALPLDSNTVQLLNSLFHVLSHAYAELAHPTL